MVSSTWLSGRHTRSPSVIPPRNPVQYRQPIAVNWQPIDIYTRPNGTITDIYAYVLILGYFDAIF